MTNASSSPNVGSERRLMIALALAWLGCGNDVTVFGSQGGEAGGSTPDGCPATLPDSTTPCTQQGATCSYGSECCCGECYDSSVCDCDSGYWDCRDTLSCAPLPCPGDPDMEIVETSVYFWIDCMPAVSADPVFGSFVATYDHSSGQESAQVVVERAALSLTGENLSWSFDVAPSEVTVEAGDVSQVTHTKVADSGSGQGLAYLCTYCGGSWTLEVQWKMDGGDYEDVGPIPIECAY